MAEIIRYAEEPLTSLLDDGAKTLVQHHWEEVGMHKKECPLAVNWPKLLELNEIGWFRAWSARKGDKLVGYTAFMVIPHIHYMTTRHALNDAIFVDPAERGVGPGLIGAAERDLAKHCAPDLIRIIYHSKDHLPHVGKLFERLGYVPFERLYEKIVRA